MAIARQAAILLALALALRFSASLPAQELLGRPSEELRAVWPVLAESAAAKEAASNEAEDSAVEQAAL